MPTDSTPGTPLGVPELLCYPLEPKPPAIVPARAARDWMDATDRRYAYRCLPLSIASASGWEVLCPSDVEATWDGGSRKEFIRVRGRAASHFGHGILTFHVGYLFRTSPGWAVWVRGTPNTAKPGITPLEGLVETDWLDFPFTMNWRFTEPGTVRFEKGEPFCFLSLMPHGLVDQVQPHLRSLADEPELEAAYRARCANRASFNERLAAREPEAVAMGWQRKYMRGENAAGERADFHLTKRRMCPVTGEVSTDVD